MKSKEEILKRKRINSQKLRTNPIYKAKEKDYSKQYRKKDEVKLKRVINQINYERRKLGVEPEDYERMLQEQDYCCKICYTHVSQLDRNLAVDHCHTTGNIRGLLCWKCNLGLGHFLDDIQRLKSAITYLNKEQN